MIRSLRSEHRTASRALVTTSAVAAAVALAFSGTGAAGAAPTAPVDTYIVDANTLAALREAVEPIPDARAEVLPDLGLAIVELTSAEASNLENKPGVSVAADSVLSTLDTQEPAPWHLDRLDQNIPVHGADAPPSQYWYPTTAGSGVRVYVIDSGSWAGSPDFTGRIVNGFDAIENREGVTVDCNGHGTAVASAAAGSVNGVAKRATIVPVRVADCSGSADGSDILQGLEWILNTHPAGQPGVLNISLGALDPAASPFFVLLEDALTNTIASGFFTAVAAGNDASGTRVPEACQVSPARTPTAFTVGASEDWVGMAGVEGRAEFSNGGSCVDAFAPGVGVSAASLSGPDSYWSGTSFSSPIAAGLAALHLAEHPSDTPAQTSAALLASAQRGALTDIPARRLSSTIRFSGGGEVPRITASPNLLLRTTGPVAPGLVASVASTPVLATTTTGPKATLSWAAPTVSGTTAVRDYLIEYSRAGGAWATYADGRSVARTFTTPALIDSTTYSFRVSAVNSWGAGPSRSTSLAIKRIRPSAVPALTRSFVASTTSAATATAKTKLTWNAPLDTGYSAVTDYVIQYSRNGSPWASFADGTSTARTFTTGSMINGYSYAFRVWAVNSYGAGLVSAVPSVLAQARPGIVQGLKATQVKVNGVRTATLSWAKPLIPGFSPVTDYLIQSSRNGGPWLNYVDGKSTAGSFTSPALSASSSYVFRVYALNSFGYGPAAGVLVKTPV